MTWFSKEQMQQLKELIRAELTRLESHMNTEFDNVNEQLRNLNERLVKLRFDNVNEQRHSPSCEGETPPRTRTF